MKKYLLSFIGIVILIGNASLFLNSQDLPKGKPEKAYRMRITYKEGRFKLIRVKELTMVVPAVVKERIMKKENLYGGFTFEFLNESKKTVLISQMDDPSISMYEYDDKKTGQMKGEIVRHKEITYSILTVVPEKPRYVRFSAPRKGFEKVSFEKQKRDNLGTFDLNEYLK